MAIRQASLLRGSWRRPLAVSTFPSPPAVRRLLTVPLYSSVRWAALTFLPHLSNLTSWSRTASYTYRTPGKYLLNIPSGLELRVVGQGAQGGGGGAGYSREGHQGEGGGRVVPGHPGETGEYIETKWMKAGEVVITVGQGGRGGHGVEGLLGGRGADGWMRVEVRAIRLLSRLRYVVIELWGRVSEWLSWTKAGTLVGVVGLVVAVTCGR